MYTCYCKILKRLKQLEKELQENSNNDSSLSGKVGELEQNLNINTQKDIELAEKVDNIETGSINLDTITEDDVENLFP